MATHNELVRGLDSLEERAHVNTLVAAFEAARETFARRGGAALVRWEEFVTEKQLTSRWRLLVGVRRRHRYEEIPQA